MIYITLHSIKYRWRARRIRVLLDYTGKIINHPDHRTSPYGLQLIFFHPWLCDNP